MTAPRLVCRACGRRWTGSHQRYSALGLVVRRAARRAGVSGSWPHPRPSSRCPSCLSADVAPGRPALDTEVPPLRPANRNSTTHTR